MTDIYTHHYSKAFRGLLTSLEVSVCIIAICSLFWDISKRARRNLQQESYLWRVNNQQSSDDLDTARRPPRKLSRAHREQNLTLTETKKSWKLWGSTRSRGFGWKNTDSNRVHVRRWGWRGMLMGLVNRPKNWAHRFVRPSGGDIGSSESYAMSHLYQIRCHMSAPCIPSPPYPKWPFAWMFQVWKWNEAFFKERCGGDVTTYVRFLTGCLLFTLVQCITTLPILLPIHLTIDNPSNATNAEDITRASLSNLVQTSQGRSYLPAHIVLLYWLTFTWFFTLYWIGKGIVNRRREELRKLVGEDAELAPEGPPESENPGNEGEIRGWRFRTIMVTNIPLDMRSTPILAQYFTHYLSKPPPLDYKSQRYSYRDYIRQEFSDSPLTGAYIYISRKYRQWVNQRNRRKNPRPPSPEEEANPICSSNEKGPIVTKIVWVRKISELHQQLTRRNEILTNLERGHIALAKNVMRAVEDRVKSTETEAKTGIVEDMVGIAGAVGEVAQKAGERVGEVVQLVRKATRRSVRGSTEKGRNEDGRPENRLSCEGGLDAAQGENVPENSEKIKRTFEEDKEERDNERFLSMSEIERLDFLVASLKQFIPQRDNNGQITSSETNTPTLDQAVNVTQQKTIWEVLANIPKPFLDPYQPLTQFQHIFAGDAVPLIDYFTTKLNVITAIVDDLRSRPDTHQPTGVAFVTLREPELVWRAKNELDGHPKGRVFDCRVKLAADVRDLDWERLAKVSLSTDVLRAGIVEAGMWVFTLFWIIPVSAIVTLVSIEKLSDRWGALANWLNANPKTKALLSTLVPIFLTSILSLLAPQMIRVLSLKGQKFVVRSKLFYKVLCRYWKWLFFNILIAFCVGTVAIQSFLFTFKTPADPVETIASAFPNAAAFFVVWFILQAALHSAIEQFNILGILDWFLAVRKADTPRRRSEKAIPRSFNYFYWLPNHLLVISILLIFALLNPLVLPFALGYFMFALVVFKNQFGRIYYRRWYENNGKMIYIRLLRYSLDSLVFAQLVIVALMFFLKLGRYGGACIPTLIITVAFKLMATRLFKAHMRSIDREEADLYCGIHAEQIKRRQNLIGNQSSEKQNGKANEKEVEDVRPAMHEREISTVAPLRNYNTAPLKPTDTPESIHTALTPATWSSPLPHRESSPILRSSQSSLADDHSPWRGKEKQRETRDIIKTPPMALPALVKLVPSRRWDDRPNHSAQYVDPAFTTPITYHLWLPRDPLKIINLDDTVEWHGNALVSSKGGNGKLGGDWEPFLGEVEETDLVDSPLEQVAPLPSIHDTTPPLATMDEIIPIQSSSSPESPLKNDTLIEPFSTPKHRRLHGKERLKIAQEVVAEIQREEGHEEGGHRRKRSQTVQHDDSRYLQGKTLQRTPTSGLMGNRRPSSVSLGTARPSFTRDASSASRRRQSRYDSLFKESSPSINSDRASMTQQEALIAEVLQEERNMTRKIQEEEDHDMEEENRANRTVKTTWKKLFYEPATTE